MNVLAALLLLLTSATTTLSFQGSVAGYRLAGIEPDGDPLDQVALSTTLGSAAGPHTRLVISAYLENFKPDTTPELPDLLHPTKKAQNLGGFLQGKAILTDDSGAALAIGSFVAEAFLDNSNHAIVQFYPSGKDSVTGKLAGSFRLTKDGGVHGSFTGSLNLPPDRRAQIAAHRGRHMRPVKEILGLVTVQPFAMMGKATKPSATGPLRTGFGTPGAGITPVPTAPPQHSTTRRIPLLTIVSGVAAIVCLLVAAGLTIRGNRRPPDTNGEAG